MVHSELPLPILKTEIFTMKKFLVLLTAAFIASSANAASLQTTHTAFPTPDSSAQWGVFAAVENLNTAVQTNMLSRLVVSNNSTTPYQIPVSTGYVFFTGTNASSVMAINLPPAASAIDGQEVSIFTQAAISGALTTASTGASVVGAPTTMAAGATVKFKYLADILTWIVAGH